MRIHALTTSSGVFRDLSRKRAEMSSELPCYTLINGSADSDAVPNEQQLKHDFGKANLAN